MINLGHHIDGERVDRTTPILIRRPDWRRSRVGQIRTPMRRARVM